MAYQALYRKYRPSTFSDVVGQEHITNTLKNELDCGKIVHAYLFTGTRGTGKTTCAKILAKAVNCLNPINGDPCGECEICRMVAADEATDIVEMDAASNNGVDDIRELREQVNFSPAACKYRVYIIDEVHMLSGAAFNALLKTLEEPPEHVVFILATTEVHKLPATILSRCQRFDFRRIDSAEIVGRLKHVASCENLTLTDDAATLIASAADGGMRDALSILDLCASHNSNITEDTVANVCSMAGNEYLIKMADLIKSHSTEQAITLIDELHNSSVDMLRLLSELTGHFRDLMIVKVVKGDKKPIVCSSQKMKALEAQAQNFDIKEIMAILSILQASATAMQNGNRRCEMEMAIIRLCNPQIRQDLDSLERRIAALESNPPVAVVKAEPVKETIEELPPIVEEEIPLPDDNDDPAPFDVDDVKPVAPPKPVVDNNDDSSTPVAEWQDIIGILRKTCPIIASVLGDSKAYVEGDKLLIDTNNTQFKALMNGNNPVYRDNVRKAAQTILGKVYKLGPYHKKPAQSESADPLQGFAAKLKQLEKN
ncbi:MAG: DNA polymerase III subunit gamma/tau [Clostridia bacterium]|nr:DNA polymerase III subunit gamma/tau [Clostridia bacterium]